MISLYLKNYSQAEIATLTEILKTAYDSIPCSENCEICRIKNICKDLGHATIFASKHIPKESAKAILED